MSKVESSGDVGLLSYFDSETTWTLYLECNRNELLYIMKIWKERREKKTTEAKTVYLLL